MIVRADSDALLLITQPDHARLAGAIAERFAALAGHPRRASILRAVVEHDAGWSALDAAPTVDGESGEIADYVRIALPLRQGVWPRGVAALAGEPWRDPWAAALVAHHALVAYARFQGEAEWAQFFTQMRALRDRHVEESGRGSAELEGDYPFLRLADLVSLAFCTGRMGAQQFAEWTVTGEGARVVVTPDLFAGDTVPLAIEARAIPRQPYRSDGELRAALQAAGTRTLRGEVRRPA